MAWEWLQVQDTINGKSGKVIATIDGRVEDLIHVRNVEAKADKKKTEINVLGYPGSQHKAGGWSGTGTMNLYYGTPLFKKMMLSYMKTGKDLYFDMIVENEDPTSGAGKQSFLYKGVNIDSVVLSKLDVDAEFLDEDVSFTFHGVEPLSEFND